MTVFDPDKMRVPPHDAALEQQVLGVVLVEPGRMEAVAEILDADDFAIEGHAHIYGVCKALYSEGRWCDVATVAARLKDDPILSDLGGVEYLYDLCEGVITVVTVKEHAKAIRDLRARRDLIVIGRELVEEAHDLSTGTAREVQERKEMALFNLATTKEAETGWQTMEDAGKAALEAWEFAYKHRGDVIGVPSGFPDLDNTTAGWQPSDLIILAGRPSMGKTAFATTLAQNAARGGKKVGFFSMEMSAQQLAERMVAARAGVPSQQARLGHVTQKQMEMLAAAEQEQRGLPLFIDETPALSVAGVRTRARRLARKHGLDLVVIDYLQLMRGQAENRVQEISEITRGLKGIAKELNVPVIALSQLSRAVEQREDKRPQLSDLRESGTIEQDADVVMFIYREEYYLSRAEPQRKPDETDEKFNARHDVWEQRIQEVANVADIIVAKQRRGPIRTVPLRFDHELTTFQNLAQGDGHGGI